MSRVKLGSRWVTRCSSPHHCLPAFLFLWWHDSLKPALLEPVLRWAPGSRCNRSWDLWLYREEPRVPNMAAEPPGRHTPCVTSALLRGQKKKQALFMARRDLTPCGARSAAPKPHVLGGEGSVEHTCLARARQDLSSDGLLAPQRQSRAVRDAGSLQSSAVPP